MAQKQGKNTCSYFSHFPSFHISKLLKDMLGLFLFIYLCAEKRRPIILYFLFLSQTLLNTNLQCPP